MGLRLIPLALVAAFFSMFVLDTGGASSQQESNQRGGAAGLVAAVVQLVATDVIDIEDTDVQVGLVNVDKSLNNLRALNNVLNNSPILSNNDIDIVDVIDIDDVNVLDGAQVTALNNFLNHNDVDVGVGVAVLDSGDLIVLNRD